MLRCSAVDDEELAEVEALIELKVRIRPEPLLSLALWHSRGLWPNGQKRKLELLKRKKGKAAESKGDTKSDGAADESQSTCDGGVCPAPESDNLVADSSAGLSKPPARTDEGRHADSKRDRDPRRDTNFAGLIETRALLQVWCCATCRGGQTSLPPRNLPVVPGPR